MDCSIPKDIRRGAGANSEILRRLINRSLHFAQRKLAGYACLAEMGVVEDGTAAHELESRFAAEPADSHRGSGQDRHVIKPEESIKLSGGVGTRGDF